MRWLLSRPKNDIFAAVGFLAVLALLVLSGIWAYRQVVETPPFVDPVKYPIRGIDISRHNGSINFEKVAKAGIEFVFIKASEGESFQDKFYKENFEKAKEAGLKTGAYHFFRFDVEGVIQAINFLNVVGESFHDLGLVVDVEKDGNPEDIDSETVKQRLSTMIDYMNLLGHRVMIYTNLEGYFEYMVDEFPGYPLWICRFQENPINAEWTFWQYDHHGKVDGIKGEVDMNAFCGSREDWARFLRGDLWPYAEQN